MGRKKRSIVWTYFTCENENEAKCSLCSKSIRYCGNTTNLFKHMKNHKEENSDLLKQRRQEEEAPPQPQGSITWAGLLEAGEEYRGSANFCFCFVFGSFYF